MTDCRSHFWFEFALLFQPLLPALCCMAPAASLTLAAAQQRLEGLHRDRAAAQAVVDRLTAELVQAKQDYKGVLRRERQCASAAESPAAAAGALSPSSSSASSSSSSSDGEAEELEGVGASAVVAGGSAALCALPLASQDTLVACTPCTPSTDSPSWPPPQPWSGITLTGPLPKRPAAWCPRCWYRWWGKVGGKGHDGRTGCWGNSGKVRRLA